MGGTFLVAGDGDVKPGMGSERGDVFFPFSAPVLAYLTAPTNIYLHNISDVRAAWRPRKDFW